MDAPITCNTSCAKSVERVHIDLPGRAYDIVIGSGLLSRSETWAGLPDSRCAVIVTNTTIGPLWCEHLKTGLERRYPEVAVVSLPDGEEYKNWVTLNLVFDELLAAGCDRRTILFALGGGVVGDMTGFAAACYMRGIACVQVPTTLLAQVDSSVGGKTAINHPLGKNMIGVFSQPRHVVTDIDTLATLPTREFASGLAEVIKYGPIADVAFLEWLEKNLDALLLREPAALIYAIRRCCEIKAGVVASDEREADVRAILNFGHTFGHSIETGTGYGTWLHGEAIGCGMVMAAALSVQLGLINIEFAERITTLVARAGLPIKGPRLGAARYLQLMRVDKKSEAGAIRYVVIEAPGRAGLRHVDDDLVRRVLEEHT